MTTPAAAPAAPAAVAPAASAAPAPAVDPNATSVVPVATPPVEPTSVAPVVAPPGDDSILPPDPAAAPATPVVPTPAVPAAPTLPAPGDAKWFYSDGSPGKGEPPEWFKANKYVTVEEQAKAYNALESRFGAFTGAPKDGKYEPFKAPEGLGVELVGDHPLLTDFDKWAASKQLNAEGRNELLTMLAQYEAAQLPDLAAIKARVGENADARISAVDKWGRANLDPAGYATLRAATSGVNADAVFKVVEALISKSTQVALPKPGADIPPPPAPTQDLYMTEMNKKDATGRALYFTDPIHRARVDQISRDMFNNPPQQ